MLKVFKHGKTDTPWLTHYILFSLPTLFPVCLFREPGDGIISIQWQRPWEDELAFLIKELVYKAQGWPS